MNEADCEAGLTVVSHRGPGGNGGVAAALDPVLTAAHGQWVACDGLRRPYQVLHVHLDAHEREGYYHGYANSGLWPLCHSLVERATFRAAHWDVYRAVNARFARAVAQAAPRGGTVWVHDYQLALVPHMLRVLRPDLSIALFWHIPWPPRHVWRLCPQGRALVEGMLGADLIGFHIPTYVEHFAEAAGRPVHARAFPIGVDFARLHHLATARATARRGARLSRVLDIEGRIVGVGVDRLDYTKGLLQRLDALDALFERHPEHRGRLTFVQVAAPTRTGIAAYRRLRAAVRLSAVKLNRRWGTDDWRPVRLLDRRFGLPSILALYRLASFALVTPLYDGMNLVAKEFVAARGDEQGALVLSQTAGAAAELAEALSVNPLDPDGTAEAIHAAITMSPAEQRRRMAALRGRVGAHDVHHWVQDNLTALRSAVGAEAVGAR